MPVRGFVAALFALALAACASKQADLTPEQEYFAGRAFSASVVHEYKRGLVRDDALLAYVNQVGGLLAAWSDRAETHLGPYRSYHFAVLDTDEVNAFAAPSGFVFVTRGLLKKCGDEDELAAVLAHEIGHVVLRHPEDAAATAKAHAESAETWGQVGEALGKVAAEVGREKGKKGLETAGEFAEKHAGDFAAATNTLVGDLIRKGYDRDKELAADREGTLLLARLRYDPAAMKRMLEKLGAKKKGRPGWVGDTHPDPKERAAAIDRFLADLAAQKGPLRGKTDPRRTARFREATSGLRGN